MIYGLYQSATGVLTNSYRQDVIANNLANAETVGFKRDLALFQERLTEAQERGASPGIHSNKLLEDLGGGIYAAPTLVATDQGETEETGGRLDLAVMGSGYFAVQDRQQRHLTRNGQFMLDRQGYVVLASERGQKVLDAKGRPIQLDPTLLDQTQIDKDGRITQAGQEAARLGFFDVPDGVQLTKDGGTLLSYPTDVGALRQASGQLMSGYLERSNVEPASELAQLMDTQRQLEANANMIRAQDQTLAKLVNEVGKIG